jgi:hypothetical protein
MPTTASTTENTDTKRVPLAHSAQHADSSAPSILDRILNVEQKASVDVASFNSSI